ncbi:MAG: coiled coil domain-containing protein [Deltaproteobacteria bacterium]|jgi:ElaB/YqjD/DUF883 family membrane-anchored ribosome-binding protein|nr:coiled coil domain-containing protein [Deltaproteobacteria bacterium]
MDTKQAYKDKLEAQLEEWRAKIAQLKAQADKKEADAKIAYSKRIEELNSKKEAVEHKLKELANASGEAWRELKSGVEKAVDDLKVSLKEASSKF